MNEETRENIRFVFAGLIAIFFIGIFIGSMVTLAEYLKYKDLEAEGYKVRFDILGKGCELKVKNIDGSFEWRSCLNLGDPFVLENYGVKYGNK